MAYTTINNGKLYFEPITFTASNNSSNTVSGMGFQPDLIWWKNREQTYPHFLYDVIRGNTKQLASNTTGAGETRNSTYLTSFNSDGFTTGTALAGDTSDGIASWNWLAAGTAPSNTYVVKVVSDSGNKYRFDNFGTSAVTLEISEGGTFTFDQSDSSNSNHPLRFSTTSNGTHGGGSEYTTGVTTNGTPGQAGAYTRITVAASAPTLYYYCTQHSGMGGQANTPVTNSFSNFAGTIQSNISPNTTSGFSVVSYSGASSGGTIGHGLGVKPDIVLIKCRSATANWLFTTDIIDGSKDYLFLNQTNATNNLTTALPTSSVFTVSGDDDQGENGKTYIAYCFNSVQGYSKFSSYVGNGNADGTFVYTGFKPAFVMIKRATGGTGNWQLFDNKRLGYNVNNYGVQPNLNSAENTANDLDLLSNGFKNRQSGNDLNGSNTYIYMAFAENPFTSSAGTPVTAR